MSAQVKWNVLIVCGVKDNVGAVEGAVVGVVVGVVVGAVVPLPPLPPQATKPKMTAISAKLIRSLINFIWSSILFKFKTPDDLPNIINVKKFHLFFN